MLKIVYYIIISILLFSFSTAAKKSVTELGTVEIDDLFYNPDSPLSPSEIAKAKFNQVDAILVENEDLELESLEIADIDLVTFGEYEDFLNKYYDDNFITINSRFIKQLEFEVSTSGGARIPAGANAKMAFDSGLDLGISIMPHETFKILNYDSKLFANLNITQIAPINDIYSKYQIRRLTCGLTSYINKNIFLSSGLSIVSSKGGTIESSNSSLGYSINIDFGFKFNVIRNINMGLYTRAQMMPSGAIDPPIDGGGTLETLSIGLIFESPVYLVY